MRVLVCGGRDYSDADTLYAKLDSIHRETPITMLIHGGARGADRLAHSWAVTRRVPIDRYDADWQTHGRAAGPIRNQQMLDEAKPALVVAFAGGPGTEDMVRRAKAAGVEIRRA